MELSAEYPTQWNISSEVTGFIVQWNSDRQFLSTPKEIKELITDDLAMTMAALKLHPKVYWIWNHRGWCLNNVPHGPGTEQEGDPRGWEKEFWKTELYVVEKLLDADSRNCMIFRLMQQHLLTILLVHAWSYRRIVLANMPIPRPETSELAYTTRKIESNFSNFSAWHQRSKVLSSLWSKGELDPIQSKEEGMCLRGSQRHMANHMLKEFDLTHNAMYTDPKDQSVWIYHRWLIGSGMLQSPIYLSQKFTSYQGENKEVLDREIDVIQNLLEEESDSKCAFV